MARPADAIAVSSGLDASASAIRNDASKFSDPAAGWDDALSACRAWMGAESATIEMQVSAIVGATPGAGAEASTCRALHRDTHRLSLRIDDGATPGPPVTAHFDFSDAAALARAHAENRATGLLEHLGRVLVLGRTLERLRHDHRTVRSIVDRVAVGICIVDASARVLMANDAAREAIERCPQVGTDAEDRVACVDPADHRRLRDAIANACRGTDGEPSRLVFRRPGLQEPFPVMLEIDAHTGGTDGLDAPGRAIVTIIDPSRPHDPGLERLVSLYRLSEAEASVFTYMVSGLTNRQIAETRHVSAETVRSQVTSVLRKLGVARRSELFRLVSAATGEWRSGATRPDPS